jgi:hypothetical protein
MASREGFADQELFGLHPRPHFFGRRPYANAPEQRGLIGKGKKEDEKTYREPMPISSLRDPASFPPPPKHVAMGAAPSPPPGQPYRPPAAGAAQQSYNSTQSTFGQPVEEAPPAPKPYRVDTTGLSTSHLPPPPRRAGGDITSTASPAPANSHTRPGPPSLPPRLPPRAGTPTSPAHPSQPLVRTPQPPQPKPQGYLNHSAIDNLSARGISVPGFNIGSTTQSTASASVPPQHQHGQPTNTGTTWAQKRAALQTASSAYKDPSSVSASDAASAASTLNNIQQRHGGQISSVAGRVNAFAANGRTGTPPSPSTITPTPSSALASAVGKKKPPPPPPPAKKPGLAAPTHGVLHYDDNDAPPPVPLATRPQF